MDKDATWYEQKPRAQKPHEKCKLFASVCSQKVFKMSTICTDTCNIDADFN